MTDRFLCQKVDMSGKGFSCLMKWACLVEVTCLKRLCMSGDGFAMGDE